MKQKESRLVKISEFAEVVTGGTPSTRNKNYWENGYIPWIASGECKNSIIIDATKLISEQGYLNSSTKMMPIDTVVIALTGATTGKVGLLGIEACGNQSVTGILPNSKFISKYLFYYLISIRDKVINDSYGGAQKHISQKYVKEIEVPLPPLETQKRIVEVLDKAQGLIDARKEQIRLMDELIQSVFYEMFGDPVTNPKGWEVVKMSSLGSFKNGMNYSSSDSGVSINCLGVGDFKSLYKIEQTEVLPMISLNQIPSEDYMLRNKDIVFVRSNGNKALVGRSVIVFPDNNKVTFSGFCIRLRVTSDIIHEEFLIQLLRITSVKNKLLSNGRGANISNLNQKMLSDVDVILPPKELQIRFIEIVEKIENQKEYMELSLSEHEMNFRSIVKASF